MIESAAKFSGVRLAKTLPIDKLIAKVIEVREKKGEAEGLEQFDDDVIDPPILSGGSVGGSTSITASTDADHHGQTNTSRSNTGTNHESYISVTQDIIKAHLVKSFMKTLKGQAREHCQMGHKLELPIGKAWMSDWNKTPFDGFQVVSLHKVGLVSKKDQPWAKDSIDFIAFVFNASISEVELWGIEIKSRQTNQTINKEREYMRKIHRNKYELINADKALRYIPAPDERYQLLHHAYVYGFKRVALIVGRKDSKVISGTVVNYDSSLRESYGRVIEKIKDISLNWAYDFTNKLIPDDVLSIAKDVKTINGEETLYGALKLWKTMFDNTSMLPRPTLKRIIPRTHAQWNSTKGGSDTITKLVDDCFIHPPRIYTNFESVAVGRCISNLFATVLKLFHVTSASHSLDTYASMLHYRNAASHRATFKRLLLMSHDQFKKEGEDNK